MKINKKTNQFLIIAGGALLLAVIGYLLFQNSQLQQKLTPPQSPTAVPFSDETANWETYKNPTYKYELKIPPEWEAFRQTNNDSIISIRPIGIKEIPIIITAQGVSRALVYNQPTDNSDQKFLNGIIDSQVGKDYPREKKVINGKEWVFYKNTVSPYEGTNYFTVNDSILYEVAGSTLTEEYINIFDQILKTFQFD